MASSYSNKSKLNWKKSKPTAAELAFKRKHDQTLALIGQVETRSTSRDKKSKIQDQQSIINNIALSGHVSPRLEVLSERQSTGVKQQQTDGGGSSSNNQKSQSSQLPMVKGAISCSSQLQRNDENQSKNDWILAKSNSSKALNERQIVQSPTIRSQRTGITDYIAAKNSNPNESMTSHVFSQDQMHQTSAGGLAFRPLGMETVLEKDEQQRKKINFLQKNQSNVSSGTPVGLPPPSSSKMMRLQSDATLYAHKKQRKGGLFGNQTTEENIAMQQELDVASAEDLISSNSIGRAAGAAGSLKIRLDDVLSQNRNSDAINTIDYRNVNNPHDNDAVISVREQSERFSLQNQPADLSHKEANPVIQTRMSFLSPNLPIKMETMCKTRLGIATSMPKFRVAKNQSIMLKTAVKESQQHQSQQHQHNNLAVTHQNSKLSHATIGHSGENTTNKNLQYQLGSNNSNQDEGIGGAPSDYKQQQAVSLHPGLQKVQKIYQKKGKNNIYHPATRQTSMSQRTDFTYALQSAVGSIRQFTAEAPTVKFSESAIESGGGDTFGSRGTQQQLIKEIQNDDMPLPIDHMSTSDDLQHQQEMHQQQMQNQRQQPLIHESRTMNPVLTNKLYLQPTGNTKEVARKLRNMQNLNNLTQKENKEKQNQNQNTKQQQDSKQSQQNPPNLAVINNDSVVKVQPSVAALPKKAKTSLKDKVGLAKSSTQENLLKGTPSFPMPNITEQQSESRQQFQNNLQRKMKSQASFIEDKQPLQNIQAKILNTAEKQKQQPLQQEKGPISVIDNNSYPDNQSESKLVNEFHMHQQNKVRMKNLMALLGQQNEDNLRCIEAIDERCISTAQPNSMSIRNKIQVLPQHQETVSILPKIAANKIVKDGENTKSTLSGALSSHSLEIDDTAKDGQNFRAMAKYTYNSCKDIYAPSCNDNETTTEQHFYSSIGSNFGINTLQPSKISSKNHINVMLHVEDQNVDNTKQNTKKSGNGDQNAINKSGLFRQIVQVNNEQQQSNKVGSLNQPGVIKHRNQRSTMFMNELDGISKGGGPGTSPTRVEESYSYPTTATNNVSKHYNSYGNNVRDTYKSVGCKDGAATAIRGAIDAVCRATTVQKDSGVFSPPIGCKLQTRSMSQHKLQPLAALSIYQTSKFAENIGSSGGTSSLVNMSNHRYMISQHLQSNNSKAQVPQKSYVLVRGKAQKSEKYISTDLQPYTNKPQHQQSTARGGTQHRRTLMLHQHAAKTNANGGKVTSRTKRVGGNKSKQHQLTMNGGAGSIREEESRNVTSSPDARSLKKRVSHENDTWQEIQEENRQLKDQLLNQIAIFEQYLKVAVLQHNSRAIEEQRSIKYIMTADHINDSAPDSQRRMPESQKKRKQKRRRQEVRTNSLDENPCILSTERDFEFDEEQDQKQQEEYNNSVSGSQDEIAMNPRRGRAGKVGKGKSNGASRLLSTKSQVVVKTLQQQQQQPRISKSKKVKMYRWSSNIMRPIEDGSREGNEYSAISSKIYEVSCPRSNHYSLLERQSPRASDKTSIISNNKAQKKSNLGSVRSNSQIDNKNDRTPIDSQEQKHKKQRLSTSIQRSLAKKHNRQMRALGYLMPTSINEYTQWTSKIQRLWDKLNDLRNDEVMRIENDIKQNRKHLKKLTLDNLFELDVNAHDHKTLTRVQHKKANMSKVLKNKSDFKKVQQLESRVRQEINRKAEFETWGFHNYIISYRIKVRMTEDIIDCAQRLQVKSDMKTERELGILKLLRDQTYEDLYNFVQKREKQPWRLWDPRHIYGNGHDFKPTFESHDLSYFQIVKEIDKNLQTLSILEKWYTQLRDDIPYYNLINSEMIHFCTLQFGNEGWLQLFNLRMLRKQQEAQQHDKQYMPPVDQIKKMEVDPYTLQVIETNEKEELVEADSNNESDKDAAVDEGNNVQPQPTIQEKKKSGWDLRKPDSLLQNTLKTGYEPIMEQRKGATDKQEAIHINEGDQKASQSPADKNESVEEKQLESNELEENKNNQNEAPKEEGNKGSTWLQVLAREKQEKAKREEMEKKARAARLAILFEAENMLLDNEDGDDDEDENFYEQDALDLGAAKGGLASYMEKIDTHLQVEKRILEAWQRKDQQEQEEEELEGNADNQEAVQVQEFKIYEQKQEENQKV